MFDYSLVERIVERIVDGFSPQMIIIFGSVAAHTAGSDSDVDILVVMETDDDTIMRGVPVRMAVHDISVDKDIIVITPDEYIAGKDDEYSFINEIVKTGYVAYEA